MREGPLSCPELASLLGKPASFSTLMSSFMPTLIAQEKTLLRSLRALYQLCTSGFTSECSMAPVSEWPTSRLAGPRSTYAGSPVHWLKNDGAELPWHAASQQDVPMARPGPTTTTRAGGQPVERTRASSPQGRDTAPCDEVQYTGNAYCAQMVHMTLTMLFWAPQRDGVCFVQDEAPYKRRKVTQEWGPDV